MTELLNRYLGSWYRHPDPANCPDAHIERVNEAKELLGSRYLCHPANHVKPIWRGPVCN